MKKFFLLRFLLTVVIFFPFSVIFYIGANGQAERPCAENYWATCCKCKKNCVVVKPFPAKGFCRDCTLLCTSCTSELGDLNLALEKLKGKNRGLKSAYDAFEKEYAEALEKYNDALRRLYGESTGDWTLSGLNGTYGKFYGSLLSVLGNTTGATNLLKAVANGIQIYQTSGTADAVTNGSGAVIDVLNSDWMIRNIEKEILDAALNKLAWDLKNGVRSDIAYMNLIKNWDAFPNTPVRFKDISNAAEFAGLALDAYGFYNATNDLFNDTWDVEDNKNTMANAKKEMDRISDSIVKNVDLMACIKATIDWQNSGKTGSIATGTFPDYAVNKNNSFVSLIQTNQFFTESDDEFSTRSLLIDTTWEINEASLKSALRLTKELQELLKTINFKTIEIETLAPLCFWITRRWKELKHSDAIYLLQKSRNGLNALISQIGQAKRTSELISSYLKNAVTGYEINYMSSPTFLEIPAEKIQSLKKDISNNAASNASGWTSKLNEKVKGELGRINMDFPNNVEWNVEFRTSENKYIRSRSKNDKQSFYDIAPGSYKLELNNVPLGDVTIEKGKEIKLKFGYLDIASRGHWSLYSETKDKYYKGEYKPQKLALPVGNYLLQFEKKYYLIKIKERGSVKFELPNPYLVSESSP